MGCESPGTIVEATLLHAPTSTKNQKQQRDPEMHQTKKGKQRYFGMKAHLGVDRKTKIIHTAVATAANVADSALLPDLLHGEETRVWGDQAYRGQGEVIRECAPQAQDCTHRRYHYEDRVDEVERAKNRTKSTVRLKVEQVFAVMKLQCGFVKLRYRGLKKNANQLFAVCALVNLIRRGRSCCFWHQHSPAAHIADHERATEARPDERKPNPNTYTGMAEHAAP
jgi:IS5 family transposase